MENEKDMKAVDKETQEFLEGLKAAELRRLLDTPVFRRPVLDAAAESERVSQAVDAVLDAEFQEMTPAQQERINRLATKLAQKYAPKQEAHARESVTSRGRQWFRFLVDSISPSDDLVAVAAEEAQKTPGWARPAEIDVEGLATPVQVEFTWLAFDVFVRYTGPTNGPQLRVRCDTLERGEEISLGGVARLGPLEAFGLSAASSKEEIRESLLDHGFALEQT